MARKLISSGSPFEQKIGYSRAVVDGRWVFVSGTTGFDYAKMAISPDVVEQAEQCFRNIANVLAQAGASLADVVQARYILTRQEYFEPIWPVLQKHFGEVRPTCTAIVAGLVDARMLVEIEVTALKAEA
jgi:enamine deaminase RidA (YjgF/YER057c/UK114 family)